MKKKKKWSDEEIKAFTKYSLKELQKMGIHLKTLSTMDLQRLLKELKAKRLRIEKHLKQDILPKIKALDGKLEMIGQLKKTSKTWNN